MNAARRKRLLAVLLIVAVAVFAGCVSPPAMSNGSDGDGSDDEDGQTGEGGISVVGPTCTVDGASCADAEVTEFSIPKMTVSVQNDGEEPARVDLNGGGGQGQQVLVSKCPQYRVKEFKAEVSQGSSVRDVASKGSVSLQPGETLDLTWFVELGERVETTDAALNCLFRFQAAFSQRLTTLKQVQVRGSEDIPRTTGLSYETTAGYPVELVVSADDSIVQQVIGGEPTSLQAKSYLVNRGAGTIKSAQYSGGPERIHLTVPELPKDCSERQVRLTQGEQSTLLDGVLCSFQPDRIESSQIYELRAQTTYTYVTQLPSVELSIHALEAEG